MIIRYCKIALLAANVFFLLLVVFNNITDYQSNFLFVQNVLNMSTTFEGNSGMWRSIDNSLVHHLFYLSIILWELTALIVLSLGTVKLWKIRTASSDAFQRAKDLAVAGITISLLQWLVAFISVGGEWFLMWQSTVWNGQDAAMRMFVLMGISLIFLAQREPAA